LYLLSFYIYLGDQLKLKLRENHNSYRPNTGWYHNVYTSWLQSDGCSGGAIWWMLTRWRPGVVDCGGGVFANCCRGSSCSLARAMDGRISRLLQHHWLLPINYHFRWL